MTKFFRDFFADESGASAAEYALILAVVGAGIAGAAVALGGAITDAMGGATNCISQGADATDDCFATAAGSGTTGG